MGSKFGILAETGNNIQTEGLVFYVDSSIKKSYPRTGATTFNLASGSLTPTGSFINDTGWEGINPTSSFIFDGSDDYINGGNSSDLQITSDISISTWIKTSSTGTMIVAAKRDSPLGGNTYGWQLYCSGGVVRFLVTRSGPTSTSVAGTTTISDGAWHHVLCTIDQDLQIALIVDGEPDGTASLPAGTFIDSNSDLRIGYNQVGSAHYYFDGDISNVAIYSRTLSASDVLQNYNAQKGRFGL